MTQDKVFVRVNISPSKDNDATLYVSFNKPYFPEYVFYNQTDLRLRVFHKPKSIKPNECYNFLPNERKPIILNPNTKNDDYLIIEIKSEDQTQVVDSFEYEIDKLKKQIDCTNPKLYVCTKMSGNIRFIHLMTLEYYEKREKQRKRIADIDDEDEEGINMGAMEEEIKQAEEAQQNDKALDFYQNRGGDGKQLDHIQQQTIQKLKIKGLGLSLVDADPKEVFYLSMYGIKLKLYTNYMKKGRVEKTRRKLDLKILNSQLDNQTKHSAPVIIGPRKAFNFQESNCFKNNNLGTAITEDVTNEQEQNDQYVQPIPCTHQKPCHRCWHCNKHMCFHQPLSCNKPLQSQQRVYMLQLYLDHTMTSESDISSQRIKRFVVAAQELNVNFNQRILTNLLKFQTSISELISDDLLKPLMKSEVVYNYNKLMMIVYLEDENQLDIHKGDADHNQDERRNKQEQSIRKMQGIMGQRPIDQVQMENADEKYSSNRSDENRFKTKEEVCPKLKSDRIHFVESEGINTNKILIQSISIKALRIYLTLRIQKLEELAGAQGVFYALMDQFASFANVTDAQLYFSELNITNAYSTTEQIQKTLTKHYMNQAISQFYKILGASDLLGNPVGLIGNLGRGVEELYSEPFQGLISGDVGRMALGIGKGVVGLGARAAYGVTSSLSKMTGTMYLGVKGFSGRAVSESNLDIPGDIPTGFQHGAIGLGKEIASGVTGVVTLPKQRAREQGPGCMPITMGACQGLFGLILTPFTGLARFLYSITTGIKNTTGGEKPNQRFRYPRYFDDREIMRTYDKELSHAYTAINQVRNGKYKNENILFAVDVSSFVDKKLKRFKDRIFVCTDERILFVQNLKKEKLHYKLREIHDIYISPQDPFKIVFLRTNGKYQTISTQKPHLNIKFVDEAKKRLEKLEKQTLASQVLIQK